MAYINGYKYLSEQDAINAREQCDEYYGIPVNEDDITKNWVEYQTAVLDNPIFWYIVYDETLLPILGQPILFEVTSQIFPPIF
jgi:hypothetical protein